LLSLKILYTITSVVLILFSIYSFAIYKKNKIDLALRYLTYFCTLYAVGLILFVLRNQISDFLSIPIANSLFAIGSICLYIAIRALINLEAKWQQSYWIPVLMIFIGFCLFTYISFDANIRMFIFYFFLLCISIIDTRLFILYSSSMSKTFNRFSIFVFLLCAVIFLSLCIYLLFHHVSSYFFSNIDIILYIPCFYMLLLNIWVYLAIQYRLKY
jgi:hypothetical protein